MSEQEQETLDETLIDITKELNSVASSATGEIRTLAKTTKTLASCVKSLAVFVQQSIGDLQEQLNDMSSDTQFTAEHAEWIGGFVEKAVATIESLAEQLPGEAKKTMTDLAEDGKKILEFIDEHTLGEDEEDEDDQEES